MFAKGLDFTLHPVTTGLLSIGAAIYCIKRKSTNRTFIMIGAAAMNCFGGFNDCVILNNNIQEKNELLRGTIIKKQKKKEIGDKRNAQFPLLLIGQLTQICSFGVNSYYFYESRNLYNNKEFLLPVISYGMTTFLRFLLRLNIQKES